LLVGYDSYEIENKIEACYKKIATMEKSAIARTVGNTIFHRKSKYDGVSNRRKD